MVAVGTTAKRLREKLGWTQRETAKALDVTGVHLCNVENGKTAPSQSLLDRYRQLWGIDLYVLAWCEQGDENELPVAVRGAAQDLADAWRQRIDCLIAEKRKGPTVYAQSQEVDTSGEPPRHDSRAANIGR